MFSSLAPAFLLSMPHLRDPNFARTVVLLCKHKEDGAFGLVVNRPLAATGRVFVDVDPAAAGGGTESSFRAGDVSRSREPGRVMTTDKEFEVWIGGPVEPQRSLILVGDEIDPNDGIRIADGLFLSTSPHLLRRLLEPDPPPRARLIIGYSGWGPGQLEAELGASDWLLSDIDGGVLFDTPADRMWETAIRRLGADPATLMVSRGFH